MCSKYSLLHSSAFVSDHRYALGNHRYAAVDSKVYVCTLMQRAVDLLIGVSDWSMVIWSMHVPGHA